MKKKVKIQIVSWLNGKVLFEYSCVNNTIKKTVEEAVSSEANLGYADLRSADLRSANLRSANLRYADLRSADLGYANLRSANLRSANLRYADLRSANLGSANLRSANLRYADLRSAKNSKLAVAMTRILPDGDIIGWKKCNDNVIVKLLIPAKAKRSHAFGRKCRAEYAEVLKLCKTRKKEATSTYSRSFKYKVGEIVRPDKWDDDFTNECSGGIHFYITKEEAEAHV